MVVVAGREEFIKERMGKTDDLQMVGDDDGVGVSKAAVVEKPVLQPVIPLIKAADEEQFNGAPMPWNTGIAEVELPMSFKWKNIEVGGALARVCLSVWMYGCMWMWMCVDACGCDE